MRTLFGLVLLLTVLLLTSNIAIGQEIYTVCDVIYDDQTNLITAFVIMANGYDVSYIYNPAVVLTLDANYQRIADIGAGLQNGSVMAYTQIQAQENTEYMVNGYSYLIAHFYYLYYPEYWYYDAYNFIRWGSECTTGMEYVSCIGYGPPTLIAEVLTLAAGTVSKTTTTPPCDYPTALIFFDATSGGNETLVRYKWTSSLHGEDISGFRSCNTNEVVDFTGDPSYPPQPTPFKDIHDNPWPTHYTPNSRAIMQPQGDDHDPGALATPFSNASITGTQKYYYNCPCHNNNAPTLILGPIIFQMKVMSTGGGHWVYEFWKGTEGRLNSHQIQ